MLVGRIQVQLRLRLQLAALPNVCLKSPTFFGNKGRFAILCYLVWKMAMIRRKKNVNNLGLNFMQNQSGNTAINRFIIKIETGFQYRAWNEKKCSTKYIWILKRKTKIKKNNLAAQVTKDIVITKRKGKLIILYIYSIIWNREETFLLLINFCCYKIKEKL